MKYLLFLALVFGLACGCKSAAIPLPTKEITEKTVTKEIIRDTVFLTEKDSSFYKALLECQDGKVVVKKVLQSKSGKHLNKPDVNITDNVLTTDCRAEAQRLFAEWKDTYTSEFKGSIEKIPYPVERQLTNWQVVQIWCGRVWLLCVALLIAIQIYKFYKPKK